MSKNKFLTMRVSAIFLAFLLSPVLCLAESDSKGTSLKSICQEIARNKSHVVFLVSPQGYLSRGPIDVGRINLEELAPEKEGLLLKTRYHLVVRSPKYVPLGLVSNTSRTVVKKIQPICPGTTEYSLDFVVDASVFVPQASQFDPAIEFIDSSDDFSRPAKAMFESRVIANVVTPYPVSDIGDKLQADIENFFLGSKNAISLPIKNAGNALLRIKKIRADHMKSPSIVVKSENCQDKTFLPGEACNIELLKISPEPIAPEKIYSIHIDSNFQGGDTRFEFWIQQKNRLVGGLKY